MQSPYRFYGVPSINALKPPLLLFHTAPPCVRSTNIIMLWLFLSLSLPLAHPVRDGTNADACPIYLSCTHFAYITVPVAEWRRRATLRRCRRRRRRIQTVTHNTHADWPRQGTRPQAREHHDVDDDDDRLPGHHHTPSPHATGGRDTQTQQTVLPASANRCTHTHAIDHIR